MASDVEPSRHTEVERKFSPAETSVSPSFDGLSSIGRVERLRVQHLDAVYFDTPEQDLAAHRITLRRRTGGPDAGWHLKLPAGPEARTEVRAPLGEGDDEAVPEELRDIVLAIVRRRTLAPVARIETTRTVDVLYGPSGSALAEFCDDHVTASAGADGERQGWREWELELVEGVDPDSGQLLLERLANRLLDAGAEPAGHGSKLARVLESSRGAAEPAAELIDPVHRAIAQHLEELLVWDRAVRADAWDSIHQMRVVTRKIRSLLRASEESFGITDDTWVLEELRLLAGILGTARDAEVLAERYERALDELPSNLVRGPVRERLVDGAKRRYHAGWRRSLTAMRSERYFRLLDALDELVASEPPTASADGTEREPATIDYPYGRVRKAMKKASAAADDPDVSAVHRDEMLHKVRKRAKQLRYTAAALGEADVADRAKTIQSLLGDHQDSVVSRAHLEQEATAAHGANEDTFSYGVLFAQEAELALRSEQQLDGALKRLKKAVRKSD